MTKLYRVKFIQGNDLYTYLVDDPEYDPYVDEFTVTECDNPTAIELIEYIESEYEGANYHSMTHLPQSIYDSLTTTMSDGVARDLLFQMWKDGVFNL